MEIDPAAPVKATAEIDIAANPERVWEVIAGIDGWPSWNPDVESAALQGDMAPGSVFRWKAGGVNITSELQAVDRPHLLGWTGQAVGLRARHVYRIEPGGAGTHLITEESYGGWAARLFRRRMQRTLERALEAGAGHLKAEAERRAGG
jgi:uncharacterized protein YndB with AHSA1/START domain